MHSMRSFAESKLAVRLALLFLVVSLVPILGAAWLFARTFEESAREERVRRQRLLAERCAALVEEHVVRAHTKLRTVARFFEDDHGFQPTKPGSAMTLSERDTLFARLQERVEPPDVFLELQFFSGGVAPQILAQARQGAFDSAQNTRPDYNLRNAQQISSNFEAPLVQTPLNLGTAWRDEKLQTIEGYRTLLISVPVTHPQTTGALVAYVDFEPLVAQLETLAGDEYALEVLDKDGTLLAEAGRLSAASEPYSSGLEADGWSITVFESPLPSLAAVTRLRRQAWLGCAIAAALALVASLGLSTWITRPIARLERAAEALSSGDFTASAALNRKDEIGRLGATFDRMAGALHELDRAKSEFVANVSHELRTPLTSLKLSVANLLDGVVGEVPEGQRATLRRVQGELERLIRLVDQLLEMARLEAGVIELHRERVELVPLAREVATALEPLASEHAIAIAIEGSGTVLGDHSMLQRILMNLLDNAIKFSPTRGTVKVVLSASGFRVQDQGPGIETSFTFEPFRQGQQHGVKNPGVGLGLAIVRKLVELNGGTVRVDSGEEAGLVVELPSA